MGINSVPSRESQLRRQKIKTLGQQMKRVAIDGAGISPWEAEVLVDSIEEVYFSDPELSECSANQLKYSCVGVASGAGKPLGECAMTTVRLTLFSDEDDAGLPGEPKLASAHRRQRRLMRLADEAREQGGLLSQEDLAKILMCDVRTIRRDVRELSEAGITVATRGQQKDIGPGVSHRSVAVRLWLEGKEPVAIASHIKHSIGAVENYLEKFKRVSYLRMRNFDDAQIAMTVGISIAAAKTFVGIHKDFSNKPFFKNRMDDIRIVGSACYRAVDEKKDSPSLSATRKGGSRR